MAQSIRIHFRDELYDGQFARTLSASYAGMADLGEAFATASTIDKPTPEHWFNAWSQRAEETMTRLDATGPGSDPETDRSLALRASEYFRQ
ncbi:MAG: hypothetical protein ACTHMX_10750, partial [Thermomicrobiales bacterium]